ncbi:MAG: FtsW/RodA/SpoVE family cell cycle protein [Anaerolineae bacterium]|nr:FtsW/RodA/SpoVE family cell cycle protein [Anaerolineae bacterium]
MARRQWRNFDYLLLIALLALAAYGVTMIYSATLNTIDLGTAPRRQAVYVVVGAVVLLVTAAVDYRLLEMFQHRVRLLSPVVVGFAMAGIVVVWRMGQVEAAASTVQAAPSAVGAVTGFQLGLFRADAPAVLLGLVLVAGVFLADECWIRTLELAFPRLFAAVVTIGMAGAAYVVLSRSSWGASPLFPSYLLVSAVAVVYLIDCLTLRFADMLGNMVYLAVLAMLAVLFIVGQVSGGAQSWLGAGAVQPSELSKILLIIIVAKFLAEREAEGRIDSLGTLITSLGLVALPMVLIYLQPDLGTALSLGAMWLAMVWMAGIPLRYLLLLAGGAVTALPLLWLNMEDYMRDRLLLFLNPNSDPDAYFNVHQALVSIGSGGWTGKGLTQGSQSQLHFLRVRHTDFIFAVTAEELGFLGAVAMVGLLFFLLWRIGRIGELSRDTFGRLLCAGMAGLIFFQTVINIGMNIGLMPVTGLPLPFVSYGGSSFLTLMVGIGLVESVAMRHKKLEFD